MSQFSSDFSEGSNLTFRNLYADDIRRYPRLTVEEEADLFRKIRRGDRDALDTLIKCSLWFVCYKAKKFLNLGLEYEDLVQEGIVGLYQAVEKFDERLGFRFTTYAESWVSQSMYNAVSEQDNMVRLPQNKQLDLAKLKKSKRKFEEEYYRSPSVEEIGEITGLSENEVIELIRCDNPIISLEVFVDAKDDEDLREYNLPATGESADAELMRESVKQELRLGIDRLSPKERQIIYLMYGLDLSHECTLKEAGDFMGMSIEGVRKLKLKALKHLHEDKNISSLGYDLAA